MSSDQKPSEPLSAKARTARLCDVMALMLLAPLPVGPLVAGPGFRIRGDRQANKQHGAGGLKIVPPSQEEAEKFCREQDQQRPAPLIDKSSRAYRRAKQEVAELEGHAT